MVYSSNKNELIKSIKKLNLKKYRDSKLEYLVEGEHLVKEAIKTNVVKYIVVEENYNFDTDIKKIEVTYDVLKYISNLDNPQKIMAVCKKIENKKIGNRILILDDIQDPGNLGTIIRSCVAFNIDTLVLSESTVDVYNSKVIRASQGMLFKLNIIVTNIDQFIKNIKSDYKIIGTDVNNGSSIKDFKNISKFAIIMGNEGNGLNSNIKELCDDYIYIPMNNNCESLNVGVAASIIMYELGEI